VFFAAWVVLEAEAGERREHRIVGPDEFDMDPRYVSVDSPLGRALLGKPLDAEVRLALPAGERVFAIVGIRYGEAQNG